MDNAVLSDASRKIECMNEKQSPGDAGTALLAGVFHSLAELDQAVDDAVHIDRIRVLEELKSAVAAAQVRETVAFVASQRSTQRAAGVPAARADRGVAAQVGLARRVSPFHAARYVGWARILTSELPATLAALQAGQVSEWRAMIVARETAGLSREHRAQVDTELAPQLSQWGDRRVEGEVKTLAYRLDPAGYVERLRVAESQRRVGLRPAPDAMTRLTGVLPLAHGVAAYSALTRAADSLIARGDARTRGQIMADTLVERVTGQTHAGAVPVEVNLLITDETLLGGGAEPGHVVGHGPVPAPIARRLALGDANGSDRSDTTSSDDAGGAAAPRWLRRLFTAPGTGELAAMETRRRCFTPTQRHFIALRDRHCRTPWCDAPIRHTDHVIPAEHGGATSVANGQGYCEACNHNRQAPGWVAGTPTGDAGDEVEITTPTSHRYRSRPPHPPGRERRPDVNEGTDRQPLGQRSAAA